MAGWWQELVDLVLSARCAGCGAPGSGLCARCRQVLRDARVRPVGGVPGLPSAYAAGVYADELRALLLAHKERGALRLAHPLGQTLAGAVRAALAGPGQCARTGQGAGAGQPARPEPIPMPGQGAGWAPGAARAAARAGPVLLVPVPSARRSVAARGHDPVRRLARAAASALRSTGVAARAAAVLCQHRPVADQARLTPGERHRNLAGALTVAPGAVRLLGAARAVVVVDDLVTTGASLAEAVRALTAAGAPCAGAAVVALAPRPG
ncbi:ComF family protein [Streptomyces sp. JJ66]|nr:ComF family protein [Streptomyces sp. JJ66]